MSPDVDGPDPIALVTEFLDLLAGDEIERAVELLSDDVHYTNVSLPSMRGREEVRRALLRWIGRPGAGFEVYTHSAAANGPVVLNERTDVLTYGRLRIQLWVYGRFEVRDGQITVWRDSFDWLNFTIGIARGLLGVFVPALAPKPPVI